MSFYRFSLDNTLYTSLDKVKAAALAHYEELEEYEEMDLSDEKAKIVEWDGQAPLELYIGNTLYPVKKG